MVSHDINDYIEPLHVNGMSGRMLRLPAEPGQQRELMVVYGHHSSLERWWGLVQAFNDYGAVVMPDLPGFGGMDSFFSIGKRATLDDYADYIASLIKLRYKRRRVTLVGISFGFIVVTRMLQRYPELADRVEMLISAVGFMRADDFLFTKARMRGYLLGSRVLKTPVLAKFFRYAILNRTVLRTAYARTHNAKVKFAQANGREEFDKMMDMEIVLWQCNDVRTYFTTSIEMLTVDNCDRPVHLPVWHVYTENDNYFDNSVIEQQMRVVFDDFYPATIDAATHAPSVLATKEESIVLIPEALRAVLRPARPTSKRTSKKKPAKRTAKPKSRRKSTKTGAK